MIAARALDSSCIRLGQTLIEAIRALNGPAEGMAIISDNEGRVVGVLTDGDVRRALMKECRLDACIDSHLRRDFLSVSEADSRERVLDLMKSKKIKHLPILDDESRLLGIHLLHELIGPSQRPNHALVMAGGLGMRLRPITENIPKPMVKVAGRPILERIVLQLVGAGITRVHLAVNYLSEVIEGHFGDGRAFGCRIDYVRESQPLGTGGSIGLLQPVPESPLLVMNGDLQIDYDLGCMLDAHEASAADVTVGLRRYTHEVPFGCVTLESGCVTAIQEKPTLERLVNTGIYVLNPDIVAAVPPTFLPITDLLNSLIESGRRIHGFELLGDWLDVGDVRQLSKARGET